MNASPDVPAGALEPLVPAREKDDRSTLGRRQFIGHLGLWLPVLLLNIDRWRPTAGLERGKLLSSVSAYYYTGGVAAFVGTLITLAVFLLTYRGYDNKYGRCDRVASRIAGAAAAAVAFFPTGAPGNLAAPSWWTPLSGKIHFFSAGVLFTAFIVFSVFLFPKSKAGKGERLPWCKRARNGIHVFCGVAMLACIIWVGIAHSRGATIFWPEALALEFFAISWLVKGRADRTVAAAGKRALHYVRR